MRFLLRFTIPIDQGNDLIRDPKFGEIFQGMLADLKPEAVYLTLVDGGRGGYMIVNMDDASQLPALVEPLFLALDADVEVTPVMVPQDLVKGMPAVAEIVKKWG